VKINWLSSHDLHVSSSGWPVRLAGGLMTGADLF
jgi:hypothetical protein